MLQYTLALYNIKYKNYLLLCELHVGMSERSSSRIWNAEKYKHKGTVNKGAFDRLRQARFDAHNVKAIKKDGR